MSVNYVKFVVDDNSDLFTYEMCDARKDAYRAAASVMFMRGCYDDGAFLMALIGEPGANPPFLKEVTGTDDAE